MVSIITSIAVIALGLMAKYASQDGWLPLRKYWSYILIGGLIGLVIDIYRYLK
ncbi:hypothetical protein [Sphingobacterium sp. SGR-19]|uniref:hypothetical protein n=1 Tax=Sphingobacterium sp. SGR-19 TaxID=2710886 RepID=UPI0013ED7A59|nr:hypothetical protein [Sphingobacterium sp. SGR-19]NGM67305.1 hypothetical protein [Sphingobacterium sp. SGR-19]